MKNLKYVLYLTIGALFLTQNLSAFSIGRQGEPYYSNGVEWQNVRYEDNDAGFTATLPGSPSSGMSGGYLYCYSQYESIKYEIKTPMNSRYQPPKEAKDFLKQVQDAYLGKADVQQVDSKDPNVKYLVEVKFNSGNLVCRIYCSRNALYYCSIQGEDLSLAPQVFDSLKITK